MGESNEGFRSGEKNVEEKQADEKIRGYESRRDGEERGKGRRKCDKAIKVE